MVKHNFDADDLSNLEMAAGYIRQVRDRIETDTKALKKIDSFLDPIEGFAEALAEELK